MSSVVDAEPLSFLPLSDRRGSEADDDEAEKEEEEEEEKEEEEEEEEEDEDDPLVRGGTKSAKTIALPICFLATIVPIVYSV